MMGIDKRISGLGNVGGGGASHKLEKHEASLVGCVHKEKERSLI
jgi:hypothetical protein